MCGGGLIELSSTATAINKKLTLPAALYRFMEAFGRTRDDAMPQSPVVCRRMPIEKALA